MLEPMMPALIKSEPLAYSARRRDDRVRLVGEVVGGGGSGVLSLALLLGM